MKTPFDYAAVIVTVLALIFVAGVLVSCGSPSVDETWLYRTL